MKTRRLFLMLAVAGLVYGCSKDEIVGPVNKNDARAISFRLQGSMPAPRATSIGIAQVNTFVVNGSETKDKASLGADYQWNLFNAVTVYRVEDKQSNDNQFDYNPKKYYSPGTAFSQFVAYSPQTKNVTKGLANNSTNTISYKVPQPDPATGTTGSKTTQEDFLVSFATGSPGGGSSDAVQLAFQHALARVFVSATNNTSEDVIIKELTLKNLYTSGDLKLDGFGKFKVTTDPGANPYPATATVDIMEGLNTVIGVTVSTDLKILWENHGDIADLTYVLPLSGVAVPRRTLQANPVFITSKEQGMMVLPQLTNWNYSTNVPEKLVVKKSATPALVSNIFYLKVAYVHANLDNELYIPVNIKNLYSNFSLASGDGTKEGIAFEFGRQYNFVINFTATEINFTATVEDWSEIVGGSVYP
jgi:hypothetical protein